MNEEKTLYIVLSPIYNCFLGIYALTDSEAKDYRDDGFVLKGEQKMNGESKEL